MNKIVSYKRYPANVEICVTGDNGDHGVVTVELNGGADFSGATWTDEEAEEAAREILRDKEIDDATADHYLVSLIAEQFPRTRKHFEIRKTYTAGVRRGETDRISDYTRCDSLAGASRDGASEEWRTRDEAERTLAYLIGEHLDDCGQSRLDLLTDAERAEMESELSGVDRGSDRYYEVVDRYAADAIAREAKTGGFDCGDFTLDIVEVEG